MAELYKTLVEPNHKNCETIEQAVKEYLAKARKIFGNAVMDRVSDVLIEFFDKGRCAAMATVGTHRVTGKSTGLIQFSMRLVVKRLLTMIKQIVPHELAHIICMANKWDMGHGKVWRQVCMMLGGNGDTFNTLGCIDGRLKNVYEARCDQGHSYWLTGPQMRAASKYGIPVRDHNGREFTLTKKSLTGNIKPL